MAYVTLGSMEELSIIKLNEDGVPVEFYVAKQNYESELNGLGRVLVVRKDYPGTRRWNESNTNVYATSDMDSYLNGTYKAMLDPGVREAMGATKIYCYPGEGDYDTIITLERSVFLLSAREVNKENTHITGEGTALSSEVIRKVLGGAAADRIWTRSPTVNHYYPDVAYATMVSPSGGFYAERCNSSHPYRPAFTLPASLYINDDGTISIPDAPNNITVPMEVIGGNPLTVVWDVTTCTNNALIGYDLERQVDGGEWTQIYRGEATSHTDAINRGWLTVAFRVRAYVSGPLYSGYTTSPTREVNNNRAPAITCTSASGADLGTKTEGFTVSYSAADADGDPVTVTEAIDGVTLRTFTPEAEESCTFALTGETWMKILNGAHELSITASDGQAQAVHTLAFTKSVTAASVTLAQPMEADEKITLCVLSVTGSIPEDADYSVKVTNNALDDAPVWEDCTDEVKLGANYVFTNETAANGFAFNFKVEVERGESGQGGYINSVQGGFQ